MAWGLIGPFFHSGTEHASGTRGHSAHPGRSPVSDQHPCYAPQDPAARECYRRAISALKAPGIEFLIGGAYSLALYTGIERDTKDLDIFVRPADRDRALAALAAAGYQTEVTYPHWLAKAFQADFFI